MCERASTPARVKLFDLNIVANTERRRFRASGSTPLATASNRASSDYALPLIQGQTDMVIEDGLPRFVHLKKVKAEA